MTLHLEKKAIRALGIAESFQSKQKLSTLAGVVMRTDLVIDGFAIGRLTVSGFDATRSIISLFKKQERNDINVILLSGSVLSMYNVVDVDYIYEKTQLPVVALTYGRSKADLVANVESRFTGKEMEKKVKLLHKLGIPRRLLLKTGYPVYVRAAGVSESDAGRLLDRFTLQGAVPEPVRVAKLLARSASPIVQTIAQKIRK